MRHERQTDPEYAAEQRALARLRELAQVKGAQDAHQRAEVLQLLTDLKIVREGEGVPVEE